MIKSMKENKKKGFTLVELIVVLVILAILAALLIPALTGYIDKAKNKSIVAETRQIVMATQTLVDEKYASDQKTEIEVAASTVTGKNIVLISDIADLSEVAVTATNFSAIVSGGKITELTYTNAGKTCTYYADTANVTPEAGQTLEGKYLVGKAS